MNLKDKVAKLSTLRFTILVILGVMLAGSIVLSTLFLIGARSVMQDNKNKSEIELMQSKKDLVNDCIEEAHYAYLSKWNTTCEVNGEEEKCGLNLELATPIEDSYKNDKNNCYLLVK